MNLANLNSLTKYPSIPTYHLIGDKGRLSEATDERFATGETLYVTEKIDGTNARIVIIDEDYFIGSREHLLYARGDRIGDPAQGIVQAVRSIAGNLVGKLNRVVLFGEVYGGKVSAASKQYTTSGATGFRLFDIMNLDPALSLIDEEPQRISAWRDNGGQMFAHVDEIREVAETTGLSAVPLVVGGVLPKALADTHDWLKRVMPTSTARIDDGAPGRPEGVVVRNADRSRIYKIRFEDYQRTLG